MTQDNRIHIQTEAARAASKRYREKNKLKAQKAEKEWRKNNQEHCRVQRRIRYQKDKEKFLKYNKDWKEKNPQEYKVSQSLSRKKWYTIHKEKVLEYNEVWRNSNKDKVKNWGNDLEKTRIWYKNKLKNDLGFRLRSYTSSRIHAMLNGKKTISTLELLGCNIQFYKEYLEKRFQSNMTWDNHGIVWEIDHVIPVSQFDLTDPEQQRLAFHWSNTRPLLKQNNRKRSNTMDRDAIDHVKELKIENLFTGKEV